jgi:hypothetical protein
LQASRPHELSPPAIATKRAGEHIIFEWLIPLLPVGLPLIWLLDLPEIFGEALVGLVLAAIVGAVKLVALLIRKLFAAEKPQP